MLDEPLKYLEELFNYVLIKKNHFYLSSCLLSAFINDDNHNNNEYFYKKLHQENTGQLEINLDCI